MLLNTRPPPTHTRPHRRRSEGLGGAASELARLDAALADVGAALDARSSKLADTSPLARLQAALRTLRRELAQMEVGPGSMQPYCRV